MLISTEIESAADLVGQEKAIELVAKAGFDAWDFSMFAMARYDRVNKVLKNTDHPLAGPNYLSYVRRLRQVAEDNGIHCNQSHAPFPSIIPEIRSYLKRAIECTAEAGGKICVIHPGNHQSVEENRDLYLELLPFAKAHGVKIATENMFNTDPETKRALFAACSTPESFLAHLEAVNDDYLVACLDLGHAEMMGDLTNAVEMIDALGPHLQALHIHDNDRFRDRHQNPFTMQIDFVPIVAALKRNHYSGYLTLEATYYLRDHYSLETIEEGLQDMANAARRLQAMMEA